VVSRPISARLRIMAWPNISVFYSSIMVAPMARVLSGIKKEFAECVDCSEGKFKKAVIHELGPIEVKKIRAKVDMSQSEFASAFGISVSTLRHWERGDRTPQGPALVLLNIVAKEPGLVLRALAS
jgi:putative transcriptional regulator